MKHCASIGCPALRNEAVVAARLEVSAIFKWFRDDFEKGDQGYAKLENVFARHAAQLSDQPAQACALP